MKVCKRCGVEKPEEAYYLNKGKREGTCYECKKKMIREWTRKNKEKVAGYARNWRKNNPVSAKACDLRSKQKRNHARQMTLIDLNADEWSSTLIYFNNSCAVCGNQGEIHMDHFIPIASGNGDTSVTNVIPLCAAHNINKRDKHPILWLRNESGASEEYIDNIINYLAKMNGMLSAEYEDYVSEQYYGIHYEYTYEIEREDYFDLSLVDVDNFIYDDDDWYLTMLNGRKGDD